MASWHHLEHKTVKHTMVKMLNGCSSIAVSIKIIHPVCFPILLLLWMESGCLNSKTINVYVSVWTGLKQAQPLSSCTRIRHEQPFSSPATNSSVSPRMEFVVIRLQSAPWSTCEVWWYCRGEKQLHQSTLKGTTTWIPELDTKIRAVTLLRKNLSTTLLQPTLLVMFRVGTQIIFFQHGGSCPPSSPRIYVIWRTSYHFLCDPVFPL